MVYVPGCVPANYSPPENDEAFNCIASGEEPYCWPRDGMRICGGGEQKLTFYWSTPFYRENASLYINFGNQPRTTWQGPFDLSEPGSSSWITSAQLKDYAKYAQSAPNGTFAGEKILRITIHEYWHADAVASAVHPGPTLVLEAPRASMTAAASSSAIPGNYSSSNDEGKLIGIILGSCIGGVAFIALLVFYCGRCCGGCCGFAGRRENERIKRLEERRLQRDGESQIDTDLKGAGKKVQKDPAPEVPLPKCPERSYSVRPGGMWVLDMPKRASRPASSASDEIRAIHVVEEQRDEERRVEEERQEIARVDAQPPAYEAGPPKYTP